MREYLEKNYNADSMKDKELVIKLAVKALLEVSVIVVMCVGCACMCTYMHACILCIIHASSVSFMHPLYHSCILCIINASSVSFMHPPYHSCLGAVPQVVQSGSQSIEMAVLEKGKRLKVWAWNVWWRFSAVLRVCV